MRALIFLFLFHFNITAQEDTINSFKPNINNKISLFKEIKKRGEKYITTLKNGKIENLKVP